MSKSAWEVRADGRLPNRLDNTLSTLPPSQTRHSIQSFNWIATCPAARRSWIRVCNVRMGVFALSRKWYSYNANRYLVDIQSRQ